MARLRSPMRRLPAATKRAARRPGAAPGDIPFPVRPGAKAPGPGLDVRRVRAGDVPAVVALDERITGLAKPDYWQDVFDRYGRRRLHERMFLVAQQRGADGGGQLLGFVVGEVRAWEFGSTPCGWVLALSVEPRARLRGIGRALLDALSTELRAAGLTKMRTMVARGNRLHLLFFRSEGMMAGPYLQLEKDLD
jgi:GNAT superfamily N-acetyltransferase